MLNAPQLQVESTELDDTVLATVVATGPAMIYYGMDYSYGNITMLPALQVPGSGSYQVLGLPSSAWLSMYAVHVSGGEQVSPPSQLVRVRTTVAPNKRITVMRSDQTEQVLGRTNAFRMIARVQETVGIEKEVFLYRRELFSSVALDYRDVFVGLCKPGDFEYPANAPVMSSSPFFRLSYVNMLERNPILLMEDWSLLLCDLDLLTMSMELWEKAQVPL